MSEKERKSKWEKENNIKVVFMGQDNQKKMTLVEAIRQTTQQSQQISKDDIEK